MNKDYFEIESDNNEDEFIKKLKYLKVHGK